MDHKKLAKKIVDEVDDFISKLKPTEYKDGWSEDNWEEEMEKHPFFMSKPQAEGQELSPLVEALQQLKYDPDNNSPEELAKSYEEDGNQNFRRKKYRWAIDSYTKGIEAKCGDNELNAELYLNRAIAQYYIGNFKKALRDTTEATALKPDFLKAIQRGAICCWELEEYADCISWCNDGLKFFPENKTLIKLKRRTEVEKRVADRNRRKAMVQEGKRKQEMEFLKKAICERGIRLVDGILDLSSIEPSCPRLYNSKVHLEGDVLVWPVIFMYPEYGTTDYIQDFNEGSCLMDHLKVMFTPNSYAAWDKKQQYVAENLQVYFNDEESGGLIPVDKAKTLKDVVSHKRFQVHGGTPSFLITVNGSEFDKAYRKKNAMLKY